MPETEITQFAVGQMIAIARATQYRQHTVTKELMNFMKVSHMSNFSTCKDAMKQIRNKQHLLGKEHVSAIRLTERAVHRSTTILQHRSTFVQCQNPLDPDSYTRAIDGHILHLSRQDIADILQTANGTDNLFMQQQNIPEHQEKVTKEFYDTSGVIENHFKQKSQHPTRPSIDVDVPTSVDRRPEFGRRAFDFFGARRFYWEEKD
uniref:Uncharacterized protein n=1 Tax=Brassica campestris TaxID=3711 RepID=M4F5M4_BRACM